MRESGSKDGMHSTAIPCVLTPIRVRGVITRRLCGGARKETATRRIWQHKFRPRLVVTCSMQRQRDTGTKSFGDLKIRRGLSRASLRVREIQRSTFDHARSCRTPFPERRLLARARPGRLRGGCAGLGYGGTIDFRRSWTAGKKPLTDKYRCYHDGVVH